MNFTFAEVIERKDDEMAQSLKPVIDKLEDIFDKANAYFYHGNLKRPVITVSPDTANAYGWCTAWKAWADKEDAKVIFGGRLGQYKYYNMDQVIAAALEAVSEEFGK